MIGNLSQNIFLHNAIWITIWRDIYFYTIYPFIFLHNAIWSTTEAEYISASEAAKNAIWITKFIIKLGVVPSIVDLLVLYCDNNGVITQSKKSRSHQRSKNM